jgi:O-glycosyl hydrolase
MPPKDKKQLRILLDAKEGISMKKSIAQLSVVVCIIGAILLLVWGQAPALADQPFTFLVHPETTFQTIVGFGSGFNEGSLNEINAIQNPADRARAYDLLYGEQALGTNLNIVRLTISPTAKPLLTAAALGLRYNWGADQRTQAVWQAIQPVLNMNKPMQTMLKKNRPIIYAVPFTPPSCWKIFTTQYPFNPNCADKSDPKLCGGKLDPNHYQDYAAYLADFVDYYHKVLHVDIDVLSLQNEPNFAAPWDSCCWTGAELRDFLKMLAPIIHARGLNPKLMLPEGSTWNQAWLLLQPTLQNPAALSLLNIMASHSYGTPQEHVSRANFAAAAAQNGLPVWMSEMSIIGPPEDAGMGAAMSIAQYLQRDLVDGQASVWIYCFAVFRPYMHNIKGSLSVLSVAKDGSLVVPKRFWTMANYSHFVRQGWKRIKIDGLGFVNTGFINPEANGFAIVVLNPTVKPQSAAYDFGNWTIGAVEAFCTTDKLDLYHDQGHHVVPVATQPHRFTVTLPPRSVTTFTGELSHGIIQPKPYVKLGRGK